MQSLEQALGHVVGDYLARRARVALEAAPDEAVPIGAGSANFEAEGREIARALVAEAIANGLEPVGLDIAERKLSGGLTALSVLEVAGRMRFVLKLDTDPKLVEEARVLRGLRGAGARRPGGFEARLPRVYAIREEGPPYAYLMESFSEADGFIGLDKLLFDPGESRRIGAREAIDLVGAAMAPLFECYEASVNPRSRPAIYQDYVARIAGRLRDAAAANPLFRSRPLATDTASYEPWGDSFARLAASEGLVNALGPGFTCRVHGDPHPENVFVRLADREVRFIDPKVWGEGDYLFDIAKMLHYLQTRGPAERIPWAVDLRRAEEEGDRVVIDYALFRPAWIEEASREVLARVERFAERHGDRSWRQRLALGMASNLLGAPALLLGKGDVTTALVLYAEGMDWLKRFGAP